MKRKNPPDRWEPCRVPYRNHKKLLSLACFRVVFLFSLLSRNNFLIIPNLDFWAEWIHVTPRVLSVSNDIVWFFLFDSRQKTSMRYITSMRQCIGFASTFLIRNAIVWILAIDSSWSRCPFSVFYFQIWFFFLDSWKTTSIRQW